MRILYLTPDLFGPPSGIGRYCRMVCRALTQNKHRASVVSLLAKPKQRRRPKATFPYLRYLPSAGSPPQFVWRSVQKALAMRPDVVLVGHPNFAPLGQMIARLTGAKAVTFIYGIDAWSPMSSSRKRALSASDLILSISRFTATRAAEVNGIPSERVRILHNCLDPSLQKRTSERRVGPSPSLLTVARISSQEGYKGHDVVLRALPLLLKRFPDLIYDVVGDGDGRPALEELARQLGVDNVLRFHGVVSEEELVGCYERAHLFVMPSRFEGFGFVFLEAMAQGVPAIGGNADATVEVIVDGKTGSTVDPLSSEEVAQAASRLLGDAALRAQMGEAGQKHALEAFGFEGFKRQLQYYLTEVVPATDTVAPAPSQK